MSIGEHGIANLILPSGILDYFSSKRSLRLRSQLRYV
jgi:hypothetical protein